MESLPAHPRKRMIGIYALPNVLVRAKLMNSTKMRLYEPPSQINGMRGFRRINLFLQLQWGIAMYTQVK
eukprot:scaffold35115_cov20-Cyclotella_meneghiniana.AAC.1